MRLSPLVFACLMAFVIDVCSNLIAQHIKAWKDAVPFVFDSVLFIQFVLLSVISAPLNYQWQCWLERAFPGWKGQGRDGAEAEKGAQVGEDRKSMGRGAKVRDWRNIFMRWFLDCITMGALLNQSLFLLYMGIVKGKTLAMIEQDFNNDLFRLIWNSYKIWPVANFFSATFCPVERRVIFLSMCGLLWNIYLSFVAARL